MALDRMLKENVRPASHGIYGDGLVAFFETLALASFRQREVSVTLGRPEGPDCPLIGISDGFERLTGYLRREIVGRNCRFLNQGCVVSAVDRHAMRVCVRTGQSFTGVLQNRRKNGELFSNLLSMRTLRIGNMPYILGVQIDVTDVKVDLASEKTASEITALIDAIFSSNVEAWAKHQATGWITQKSLCGIHRPLIPLDEVLDSLSRRPENYEQARNAFVSLEASLDQNNLNIEKTFWEVYNVFDDSKAKQTELRKVMSEPNLGTWSWLLDQCPRTSRQCNLRRFYGAMAARPLLPLTKFELAPSSKQSRDGSMSEKSIETVDTLDKGSIEEKTPATAVADLASIGSEDHPVDCKPCSFFCYSLMGCARGSECTFCHMKHPRRIRRRGHRKKMFAEIQQVVEIDLKGAESISEKIDARGLDITRVGVDTMDTIDTMGSAAGSFEQELDWKLGQE